jgi:phage gp29-like protein
MLNKVRNYFFPATKEALISPTSGTQTGSAAINSATGQDKSAEGVRRNLSNYLTPVQLQRLKVDIGEWRRAVVEAELAYYPHRVRMQRMYIDTILNGHVYSVMEKRKDLTLLRGYKFVNAAGEENEELKQLFEGFTWFPDFLGYCLDSIFFGYTLISLGDIINSDFSDVNIVRRWNVSPDREIVSSLIYSLSGQSWNDDEYKPWHIYVKTPSENGVGKCGYGLFYKIALYEIFLRNLLGYNGDFVELYAQPYRVGKTSKTTETERAELEQALREMGSNGYAVIDPNDDITFLETALGGTGWKGYENLEQRCQKIISKIVLGHADAIDSIPGKLGGGSGEDNPAAQALADKQTKDGRFVMPIVNKQLLPRMVEHGLIPASALAYKWVLVNDDEAAEQREREDKSNLATAQVAQTMKNAGLQMDAKYFTERTGIPAEAAPEPEPIKPEPGDDKKPGFEKVKNMMDDLYGK